MSRQEVLRLYRQLLRYGRVYPSKNRDGLVQEIRTEFREAKHLSSREEIQKRLETAREGVAQMQVYCKLDSKGNDWQVSLKGGGGSMQD
mmetsp:Transcript_35743/g.77791  ORF Transcript_35743/g.77791 Transcript_35743/m.77791 type:complete len:89 (+) Transcript_35743:105-371(+)